MGKKNKHSKDKLHKTVSELRSHHTDANRELELSVLHRRIKFDTCCLSLNPIVEKPVGLLDKDGICYVFECDLIVKFLEKFQVHPITGTKVSSTDLIELKFYKNEDDQYHCPVTYKLFNQLTKIVANSKSGNVYSYDAYQQLNLKPNNFKDLLTDEPFTKEDIVWIQDPSQAEQKWKVSDFHYVKTRLKLDDDDAQCTIRSIDPNSVLKTSLDEYQKNKDLIANEHLKIVGQEQREGSSNVKIDKINSATYSDGALARSVTSTCEEVTNTQNPALLSYEQIIYPKVKSKGYIQLVTNLGNLNLELFCDRAPKTCHNFMLLSGRGYYDGTIFHRLVKDFIIQGGDPTGTGTGGESAWKSAFKDEIHNDLKHSSRGVLAMANSGPSTNKSQFYITLRDDCSHLDGKHTVFGRVVGGEETIRRMEAVDVDKKDRPKSEIKIMSIKKYVDPFEDVEAAIEDERKKMKETEGKRKLTKTGGQPTIGAELKRFRSGVGAYINLETINKDSDPDREAKKQPSNGGLDTSLSTKLANLTSKRSGIKSFGDFSSW